MRVIAAFVSTILQRKLIWYRRKQQIKCSDLCLNEVVVYRQLKKTVFKKIQANFESRCLLYHIGRKKHFSEKDIADIIKFVTKFMHNDKQSSTFEQARAKKWEAMKVKTTLGFLPDENFFCQHLLCANYRTKMTLNLHQLLMIHNTVVTRLMDNISFQCVILKLHVQILIKL